jgi:Zn-dependent peptidase ImmA (M78 family)
LTDLATKEERFAHRFSEVRGLVPRIDVLALAREVASVEEKLFPREINIDGLCLDLKSPGLRPRIWVNIRSGYHRKRFTLAHELGHVVIPWHLGNIVDDLSAGTGSSETGYRKLEAEANRFATELLMPRAWAERICHTSDHMRGAMISISTIADVSLHAAALRVTQVGPAGFIVSSVQDDRIAWSEKTKGTHSALPRNGTLIAEVDMPAFYPPEIYGPASAQFFWWKTRDAVEVPPRPDGTWREVLEYILLSVPEDDRQSARQAINAIVGYRIGRFPPGTDAGVLYQAVLAALQNRSDRAKHLPTISKHPSFHNYLLLRIYERTEKRRSPEDH